MTILKFEEVNYTEVNDRTKRKLIQTDNLMTVIVDFTEGPWIEADPYHNHPHEQTSYVAEGEIVFYCEGEPGQHLIAGDMFAVPPYKMHSIKLLSRTARLVDSFNPVREDFLK